MQHPVTDQEARRFAKALAQLFRSPLMVLGAEGFDKPVTIADAVRLGGTLIASINLATGDPILKEKTAAFAIKVAELVYVPEALEEFLYNRIKERIENPVEVNDAITQIEKLMSGPGAARRFIKVALNEVMPKGRQGRPTEFDPGSDPGKFLVLASRLSGLCSLFLDLRDKFPAKSNRAILDFLESEDPKGEALLRRHEKYISNTLTEFDFRILKTRETRARRLADAIAGKQLFGWSFTYAVQRAGEFRRAKESAAEE
jgi:hypothetical protein